MEDRYHGCCKEDDAADDNKASVQGGAIFVMSPFSEDNKGTGKNNSGNGCGKKIGHHGRVIL